MMRRFTKLGHLFRTSRHKFTWSHAEFAGMTVVEVQGHVLEVRDWSKQLKSQQQVDSFLKSTPQSRVDSSDMVEYIKIWCNDDANAMSSKPCLRVMSRLLTFPLTLAYTLSLLFPSHYGRESINVLVVGARAESSLHPSWWSEILYSNHSILDHHIRFIGPGLSFNQTDAAIYSRAVNIQDRHKLHKEPLARKVSVVNNFGRTESVHADFSRLHQHPDKESLLRWADVFVLYNPGYGNEVLQDSWSPTMELLLQTRKPLVCTAFAAHDLRRDLATLDILAKTTDGPVDFLIPPHENPYKALIAAIDDRERGNSGMMVVNHSVYAVQAK